MLLGVLLTVDIVDTGMGDCLAGCLCFGLLVNGMGMSWSCSVYSDGPGMAVSWSCNV